MLDLGLECVFQKISCGGNDIIMATFQL